MSLYHNARPGKWITFRLHPEHYMCKTMVKRPRQILVGQVFDEQGLGTIGVYSHSLSGKAVALMLEDIDMKGDPITAATILEVFDVKP